MNEIELLLTDILGCQRADLYSEPRLRPLSRYQRIKFLEACCRRLRAEPVQYILGKMEFMGLTYKVRPGVFIPRPETEILVEKAMDLIRKSKSENGKLKILDIGTGSGCITVSLAKYLTNLEIIATDISHKAIETAKYNAMLNNVANKIRFIYSNLFTSYELLVTSYDIIISNPPYIKSQDIEYLQAEVRHEPRIALDGGRDGLDFYRRIIKAAPDYLKEDGLLMLEMGLGQSRSILDISSQASRYEGIEILKDYCGIERVIVLKKK